MIILVKYSCYNIPQRRSTRKQSNTLKIRSKPNSFPVSQMGQSSSTASAAKSNVLINFGDAFLEAQIYWLAKMACNNYSLQSSDHIRDLFRTMFSDSKIAANFILSHTSASYMIEKGLSPYFTRVIIDDLVKFGLPFAVPFDETTTTQIKKQMDPTLRYWSSTHNEV